MQADVDAPGQPGLPELTARQLEVLALVCEGLSNEQIAYRLGVTTHTVALHLHIIYRKLGVHSRTQAAMAVQAAQRAGDVALLQEASQLLDKVQALFSNEYPNLAKYDWLEDWVIGTHARIQQAVGQTEPHNGGR